MKFLTRLPIILIMILLLQPLLMTILETAHQGVWWTQGNRQVVVVKAPLFLQPALDGIRLRLVAMQAKPLVNPGQRKSTPWPQWSWKSLMAGKFQRPFENWLNESLPFRANMVRMFNQIYYNWFSKSYANNGVMIIGETGQLNTLIYVAKYCNLKRIRFSHSEFKRWADGLRELSEFFAKRGQHFIFLITPSKAAYFAEYIPAQFACGSQPVRPDYDLATSVLRDSGVSYVDGSKILLDAKGKFSVELFPRGGIHWNMLGAGLTTQELLREINGKLGNLLPDFRFSYTVDYSPRGTDVDAITLLNLWRPDLDYPVPHISIESVNQSIHKKPTVAMVGGSFLEQVRKLMIQSGFFSRIDYFNYFKIYHTIHPGNVRLSVDENDPETYQELLKADIILVEENEQNLQSNHVNLLREKLLFPGNIGRNSDSISPDEQD